MPPRTPLFCKAVRRQILAPSDAVWVSDESLSRALQRFCSISRTYRRYGSSVPGPMESRRRLGKRRMTHVSEALPSSGHNFGFIWGSFWDTDRTQWQWQAPTPRSTNQNTGTASLPSWLLEWDMNDRGDITQEANLQVKDTSKRPVEELVRVEEDVRRFREAIKTTTSKKPLVRLSGRFTAQFSQSLTLGLISNDALEYALRHIPEDIQAAYPNKNVTLHLCLAFYTAVWEGIVASKVLSPPEIVPKVMNLLWDHVVSLPATHQMQSLAHKILHSASDIQIRQMECGIKILIKSWTKTWHINRVPGECTKEVRLAESLVTEAKKKVTHVRRLIRTMRKDGNEEQSLDTAQKAVSDAHVAVLAAMRAIVTVEDTIQPLQTSAKALAHALDSLPPEILSRILPACSRHIRAVCDGNKSSARDFPYLWLSVVAQIPNADDRELLKTWEKVDPLNRLSAKSFSEVVLGHWISQGKIERAARVWNTFAVSSQTARATHSSCFLYLLIALDKYRENFARTRDLLGLCRKLGRQLPISHIFSRMNRQGLKAPATALASAIKTTNVYSIWRASGMYRLGRDLKLGYPLRAELTPKLVIRLINDRRVPSAAIWKLLNIPMYKGGPTFQPHFAKPLSKEMIHLLHNMAIAFARSDARSPRAAFRNVLQCLHHLNIHRAPISPELSRAVNHAGITRSILDGLFVGQERLRYAAKFIAKVEGEAVARDVDAVVLIWRRHVINKRLRVQREQNVLRVGPVY